VSDLVAINNADADQYVNKIVALTKDVYAILLCIFSNGFYTSVGYTDKIYVPEDSEKIVLYNAAAGLNLPLDWPERIVRRCSISVKDTGFRIECSEEKYKLVSIDYETCRSLWRNSRFKTINLPSIYILSDGSTTNMIGIDYK
jgi:hypothetical protein